MNNYEFCVQVWFEDGEWNWSIVQEFDEDDVEILAYGTANSREAAVSAASAELHSVEL